MPILVLTIKRWQFQVEAVLCIVLVVVKIEDNRQMTTFQSLLPASMRMNLCHITSLFGGTITTITTTNIIDNSNTISDMSNLNRIKVPQAPPLQWYPLQIKEVAGSGQLFGWPIKTSPTAIVYGTLGCHLAGVSVPT